MRKVILLIMLAFPFCIKAACDNKLSEEGREFAKNVTAIKSYNEQKNNFTITLDNIVDGMSAVYNEITYHAKDNKITFGNIKEGQNVTIDIYYKDGCDGPVDIIKQKMPYYNDYYGNILCDGYEDKLYVCSSRFTSYHIDEDVVKLAIKNYETQRIPIEKEVEKPKVNEKSFIDKTKEAVNKWGLKLVLLIGSTTISIIIGNSLYRKEVHGI